MMNIGIICEGPTDYIILKGIIDKITGEDNYYVQLQPEPDLTDTCIVIPCDSTESWIVAAYDAAEDAEMIEEPWNNVIAKKKAYHNIRISGTQKQQRLFKQFVDMVCLNWSKVTEICISAKKFEENMMLLKEQCEK